MGELINLDEFWFIELTVSGNTKGYITKDDLVSKVEMINESHQPLEFNVGEFHVFRSILIKGQDPIYEIVDTFPIF